MCGLVCPEPPGDIAAQLWVLWNIGNLVGTGRNGRGLRGPLGQGDTWSLGGGCSAVNRADAFDVHWTIQALSARHAVVFVEKEPA